MSTPVSLHEDSVRIIDKYQRPGESRGDTAERLLRTSDSRLTSLSKWTAAHKPTPKRRATDKKPSKKGGAKSSKAA